ncbi:multidrug effflux MFS transporter [Psychromicrobium xiongbiense]|uniref:multidrug effflux MFS transporter n=1 Tax=Psychromicrobium xiongbiense TaxID=3051184 RepID=UPI002552F3DD|nr:multidrug effflux MFS transporter [Psychromicrobium sp. YIM S02556]
MTADSHPGDALSTRDKLLYIIVLGLLTALVPFTVDMYLPAFPALQHDLHTTETAIQLTLTATTVGFALGQLVVGPLSDTFGRRNPLILATAVHILASIGAALSTDVTMLGIFRVLQGIGAAGGGVVAMAMVRDMFSGYPLVKMLSRLSLVSGLAPILAPVLGSQLLAIMPWPGLFWVLAAYGCSILLASVFFLRETLPVERRQHQQKALQRYAAVFQDRIFVGMLLVAGFNFASLFVYLSATPFIFQNLYGLSAQQYGLVFASLSVAVVSGVQISSRLMKRIGPQWILAWVTPIQFLGAAAIGTTYLLGWGLWGTLIPLWFYVACIGFVFPTVQVLGLVNHGARAGTAASLMGAVTFGFGGLMSPIVGAFGPATPLVMSWLMCSSIAALIVVLWTIVRPRTVPAL